MLNILALKWVLYHHINKIKRFSTHYTDDLPQSQKNVIYFFSMVLAWEKKLLVVLCDKSPAWRLANFTFMCFSAYTYFNNPTPKEPTYRAIYKNDVSVFIRIITADA